MSTLASSQLTLLDKVCIHAFDKVKTVSSANNLELNLEAKGRLLTYIKNNKGPSVEPWGIPQVKRL